MRPGQAPSSTPPSLRMFSREPNSPRNSGSPLAPPLRMALKPGMVLRWSAPSAAGIGWRGCLGSVTTVPGACCATPVMTLGANSRVTGTPDSTARARGLQSMAAQSGARREAPVKKVTG